MRDYFIYDIEAGMAIRVPAESEREALIAYIKRLAPELQPDGYDIAIDDFNGYVTSDVKELHDLDI